MQVHEGCIRHHGPRESVGESVARSQWWGPRPAMSTLDPAMRRPVARRAAKAPLFSPVSPHFAGNNTDRSRRTAKAEEQKQPGARHAGHSRPAPGRNRVPADATDRGRLTCPETASHPDYPEAARRHATQNATHPTQPNRHHSTNATHKLPRTWAQIAIIPRNMVSEARAAASSTTARNMATLLALRPGVRLPLRPSLFMWVRKNGQRT